MIVHIQGLEFDSEGKRILIIKNLSGKLYDVTEKNFVVQAGPANDGRVFRHDAGWEFVRFAIENETSVPDIVSETKPPIDRPKIITQPLMPGQVGRTGGGRWPKKNAASA